MEILSLVVSIISIVLAIFAMYSAHKSEQASLHNFEKTQELLQKNYESTQKLLQETYDKTVNLLAEVDKKAAVIDSVVQRNQEQMMSTLTNIVNEVVIPKKSNIGEEIGAQFLMNMLSNPSQAQESLGGLKGLAELIKEFPQKSNE